MYSAHMLLIRWNQPPWRNMEVKIVEDLPRPDIAEQAGGDQSPGESKATQFGLAQRGLQKERSDVGGDEKPGDNRETARLGCISDKKHCNLRKSAATILMPI